MGREHFGHKQVLVLATYGQTSVVIFSLSFSLSLYHKNTAFCMFFPTVIILVL